VSGYLLWPFAGANSSSNLRRTNNSTEPHSNGDTITHADLISDEGPDAFAIQFTEHKSIGIAIFLAFHQSKLCTDFVAVMLTGP
jgi:hypothetical protein